MVITLSNEQVLTNTNYVILKFKTNDTQLLHRIRLRPIQQKYGIEDLKDIDSKDVKPNPITKIISESKLLDQTLTDLASQQPQS